MKNKGIIFAVLGALGTGVISYFVYDRLRKKPSAGDSGTGSSFGPYDSSGTSSVATDSFPLKKGSKGERVKALQRFLNTENSSGLSVDGIFGANTEKEWLKNQVCDTIATTKTSCWTNYKGSYRNAIVGQVDEEFYNDHIRDFEN